MFVSHIYSIIYLHLDSTIYIANKTEEAKVVGHEAFLLWLWLHS